MPYWPHAEPEVGQGIPPEEFVASRTFVFFKNFDRTNNQPAINHVQLVSAARWEESPPAQDAVLGKAAADDGQTNWSWVLSETISMQIPTNVQNVQDHVTTHELGHQLNVNQGSPQGFGHDEEEAIDASGMCQPPNLQNCCLMNEGTPPNTQGDTQFHADPMAPSQDLLCIRTHVDDLNQDDCPPFFPGPPP
jgi:hypothetical protein